jgi:hypothetical protein
MKVKAYFSRKIPFFLMGAGEMTEDQSFDAYPVMVDEVVLKNCRSIRRLMTMMDIQFLAGSAPEDCAELEAGMFADEVRRIFKTVAQDNRGVKDETSDSKSTTKADSSKSSTYSAIRKAVLREDV